MLFSSDICESGSSGFNFLWFFWILKKKNIKFGLLVEGIFFPFSVTGHINFVNVDLLSRHSIMDDGSCGLC